MMRVLRGYLFLILCFFLLPGCQPAAPLPVYTSVTTQMGDAIPGTTAAASSTSPSAAATSHTLPDATSTAAPPTTTTEPTSPPTEPPPPPTLEERIQAICQKHRTVGMSMAVFRGQEIVYSYSYGYADKEADIPACADTKYRIASISKLVTGMAVMQLRDEGLIELDTDISGYLGVDIRSPYYPDVPLTMRMLMQHTSGIVDSAAYTSSNGNPPYRTLQELVGAGGMFTSAKPGTRYQYTNFGAELMAGVMEGVTGERFYDYMQRAVMEPLGIDGGYMHTKIRAHDQVANMYRNGRLSYDL